MTASGSRSRAIPPLWSDEGGGFVIPVALALPVLFGFAMLVVDGGRFYNLHTSVQAGADALALAAAAELDGRPDAIVRAERAMTTLVQNDQRFGEGADAITRSRVQVQYLSSLPASDGASIAAANVTADPLRARFAHVQVNPVPFRPHFAAAASVTGGQTQAAASAVGGFENVACNVTPLFMCNPFEGTGTSLFAGAQEPSFKRRLISMKEKGSKYAPGNYGYLEAASGGGASALKEALALDKPRGCYRHSGVELQTGNVSSTAEAMNVRFDLYDGGFRNNRNDPAYRPARNVRKGYTGPSCSPSPAYDPAVRPDVAPNTSAAAIGLPRDGCFYTTQGCSGWNAAMDGRIGDGNWDFETYWSVTYGGNVAAPNGWSNNNRPSRYEVYRHELANDLMSRRSVGGKNSTGSGEIGGPQCFSGGSAALSDEPDRRTFVGAILDCEALDQAYGINGSSSPPLPVTAYARFFMTEPMDKNDGTIWAELVELVEPGTPQARDILRDTVQLYR